MEMAYNGNPFVQIFRDVVILFYIKQIVLSSTTPYKLFRGELLNHTQCIGV